MTKLNITTLEELEQEQKKLKLMMKVTQEEFVRSINNNKKTVKSFLINKIALPGGAIGLGYAAVKQFSQSASQKRQVTSATSNFSNKIIPLGLNILQAYLLKTQSKQTHNNTMESAH